MVDTRPMLEAASKHHDAGRIRQAEKLYREVLELEPRNADAIHALGVIELQRSNHDKAYELLGAAAGLRPDDPDVLNSLGLTHRAGGRLEEAESCFKRVLALDPDSAAATSNMAELLMARREAGRARQVLEPAVERHPSNLSLLLNLGNALLLEGDPAAALVQFRRAESVAPDNWQVKMNLGGLLRVLGPLEEAERYLREAYLLDPGNPRISVALGLVLTVVGKLDEAEKLCREAIAVLPSLAKGHAGLGMVLLRQGRLAEAVLCFTRALSYNSDDPLAQINLGNALRLEGKVEKALECYERALELDGDHPGARYSSATAQLLLGRFEQGFALLSSRRALLEHGRVMPRIDLPRWDGSPAAGRTVLLYPEGDVREAILLVRYASLLRDRVGRVALSCPGMFGRLFETVEGIDEVVLPGQPAPAAELRASLDDLPAALGADAARIPPPPYLQARAELSRRWKERLEGVEDLKVGLMWRSDAELPDPHENVPLELFEPLLGIPRTRFFGLQYAAGEDEVRWLGGFDNAEDLNPEIDGMEDALACLTSLDLLITPDNATAHLAGAVGADAWVLLTNSPSWCWQLDGPSQFYPELRLFRRAEYGGWGAVLEDVRAALEERISAAT